MIKNENQKKFEKVVRLVRKNLGKDNFCRIGIRRQKR